MHNVPVSPKIHNSNALSTRNVDPAFDYGALTPELADKLRRQAVRIRDRSKSITAAIVETGGDLLAVEQQLKERRQFCQWVVAECGFALATAYNYMNAAKFVDRFHTFPTVGNLHPKTIYALARKSTPPEIIDEVLKRSLKDGVVPFVDVKEMLGDARFQRAEAKRKENEAARRRKLTKKQREQEDALKADRERQRIAEKEALNAAAQNVIEEFGPNIVERLLEIERTYDINDFFRQLRQEFHPVSGAKVWNRSLTGSEMIQHSTGERWPASIRERDTTEVRVGLLEPDASRTGERRR